ncbi:MAG: ubiquitin carboxyl-terminal hydrolase 14 [Nitrososphaera sp.]
MARMKEGVQCTHMEKVNPKISANTKGCEECEKMGSDWVHLRLCLTCGHVGCCDSSVHKHGTKHFQKTGHPIIKSYEPGENWKWCYEDKVYLK